jgi:hypothetical protein
MASLMQQGLKQGALASRTCGQQQRGSARPRVSQRIARPSAAAAPQQHEGTYTTLPDSCDFCWVPGMASLLLWVCSLFMCVSQHVLIMFRLG